MKPARVFRPAIIGLFLLTVVVATSASFVRKRTIAIPYCEVARNAESYHGQFVTVKARVIFGSEGMYIFEDCDPVAALASRIDLEGEAPPLPGSPAYVEELLVDGGASSYQTQQADAIVAGRFDGKYSPGCWGPAFQIAATKVELVSPVTDYVPPSAPESGMRTRH